MTSRQLWLRRGTPSQPHAHGAPWDLQLSQLGVAAARETLVTTTVPVGAMWTDLFQNMLANSRELRWRDNGPGIGRDARTAYSSLLGRFMARAYLTAQEGVRVLVPLDEAKRSFQGTSYRIGKLPTDRGLEADWVGLDGGGLVIAEAKGSFDRAVRSWAGPGRLPGVVRTAIGQAQRTAVWKSPQLPPLPAKRWAIASRWSNEEYRLEPTLVAWDPEEGELDGGDYQTLARILHHADVRGILTGLGHADAIGALEGPEPMAPFPGETRLRFGDHPMEPGFGAIVWPGGIFPLRNSDDLDLVRRIREVSPEVAFVSLSSKYAYSVMPAPYELEKVSGVLERESPPEVNDRFALQSGLAVAWPEVKEELTIDTD